MFCKKESKWTEVPYVQLFFFLRDHPVWLNKCRLDNQTMVTLCKKPSNSLEPKNPSIAPSAPPLPPYPATSHTRHCPRGLYPPSSYFLEGTELMFLLELVNLKK
jgi:hypothetical protein